MTIDKQKLKALAEAANAITTDVKITMAIGADPVEVKAVQDYLQVAMPKTILALLAEIERLEAKVRLAGVAAEVTVHQEVGRAVTRELVLAYERDQLKAENEALRKDAERYRWLREPWQDQRQVRAWTSLEVMDENIDSAMAKEASHG
ncbi:hypothetical protein [Pseudomonas sp. 51_B]|uniref:hypothetical protein n=1 Tax=Pseudomonas sp. 51_B TaxID=2813573 RepID=UPI001A9D0DB8|nr:hypothetical protein [Pseudomonas sp. 51_B]